MVKAKVWIFKRQFDGFPKEGDFVLENEELPEIQDGEFLAEALYLSVDPYMRAYSVNQPLEKPYLGGQLAVIKESKNPKYPVGKHIVAGFGWRTHTISDGHTNVKMIPISFVPDFDGLPLSLGLGALGRIGNTALFGFLELCQPKPSETVVVSGAAGAVGSHVGQIAKIKGCKVIGIAGSAEKGMWLTELGFDHFINYKTENIELALKEAAPNGVDCYFDNVGGEISSIVLKQMNTFGRVSVCGSVSGYNDKDAQGIIVPPSIVSKQLKMEGFIVSRWSERFEEGILQNLKWIKEGKLKYEETVTVGFENMFTAFQNMLKGENFGKAIVKV